MFLITPLAYLRAIISIIIFWIYNFEPNKFAFIILVKWKLEMLGGHEVMLQKFDLLLSSSHCFISYVISYEEPVYSKGKTLFWQNCK